MAVPRTRHRRIHKLRIPAMLAYVSSLDELSLEDLSRIPPFNTVSYGSILKWSQKDKWPEQRLAFFEKVKVRLEKRIEKKLTQSLYREVQHLNYIGQMALERLEEKDEAGNLVLKCRSWEQTARVLMEVYERLGDVRDNFTAAVTGEEEDGLNVPSVPVNTSDVQHAIRKILRSRRSRVRKPVALVSDGVTPAKSKPRRTPVVGGSVDK